MDKKRTPELEEYLETLVRYKEKGVKPKVTQLSKDLGVSASSVSEMLKKLSEKEFVKYRAYGEIELTEKGEKLGRAVLRKHRLLESFLTFIGVKKTKVHDEACVLEHAISDDVEKALRDVLTVAVEHGVKKENIKRLTELKQNQKATIIFVTGGRSARKRLTDLGLTPGTQITVDRTSAREGPVGICIRTFCLAIGRGLAEKIFVETAS